MFNEKNVVKFKGTITKWPIPNKHIEQHKTRITTRRNCRLKYTFFGNLFWIFFHFYFYVRFLKNNFSMKYRVTTLVWPMTLIEV